MPAFYFVQIIQRFQMDKNKITSLPVVFLLAMLSCFLWGSATPAIKIGYEMFGIASSDTISIILFAGIRFFLAGILVILVQSVMAGTFIRPEKGSFPSIFKLSLAQTMIQYFCFYVGLAHTTGVTGTILSGTSGFFSIILASVLFRYEKLTLPKVIGCLMGLLGVVVMNVSLSGGVSFHFALNGEFLVLLSAISLAVSGILSKKYSKRFSVVMLSGYQFMVGGLVMIIVGLVLGGRISIPVNFSAYVLLLYMALISAVAYSVWGILLKYNPVSRVTIFNFLTPLFGVLLSAIFLGEVDQALQLNKLLALLLVSAGIYVVNRKYGKD